MPKKNDDGVQAAVMANDISYIKAEVTEIKNKLEADYVTRQELDPIKKIVYGIVALVLTAVVGGVLALVFKWKSI